MAHGYNRKRDNCNFFVLMGDWFELLPIKALLLLMTLSSFHQNSAIALSQSHHGSAPTTEFMLNASSPDARIQILSSSAVHIVNVNPPRVVANTGSEPGWKVSLELLAMQLCEPTIGFSGDKLKVVYSDPFSIKSALWKNNVSYSLIKPVDEDEINDSELELKNIQANQIVLIPEGRWILSGADLVATLYKDTSSDGTCPDDTFSCLCSKSEDSLEETLHHSHKEVTRCIPRTLVCNGHPNCGFGCREDESESICSGTSSTPHIITSCKPPENISTTTIKQPLETGSGSSKNNQESAILAANIILTILLNRFVGTI